MKNKLGHWARETNEKKIGPDKLGINDCPPSAVDFPTPTGFDATLNNKALIEPRPVQCPTSEHCSTYVVQWATIIKIKCSTLHPMSPCFTVCKVFGDGHVQWTVYNVQREMCNDIVHCVTQVGVEGNGRWLAPSLLVSGDTRAGDVQWTTFLRTRSMGVQWTTFHFSSRNTGNIVCAMKHI